MNGIRDLFRGIGGFFGAFAFIIRNRMAWMFLMPALLWVILGVSLFAFFNGPADRTVQWAADQLAIEVPKSEGFWNDALALVEGAREVVVLVVLKLGIAY